MPHPRPRSNDGEPGCRGVGGEKGDAYDFPTLDAGRGDRTSGRNYFAVRSSREFKTYPTTLTIASAADITPNAVAHDPEGSMIARWNNVPARNMQTSPGQ